MLARRSGVALALALAACDGGATLDLRFEVTVYDDVVHVSAIEPSPPHACDWIPLPELGTCDSTSDAISCTAEPAWLPLARIRVERDGALLAESTWDDDFGSASAEVVLDGAPARLVIITEGGDAVAVPIPATPRPVPTITAVNDVGDAVTVEWTSEPAAASAIISVGAGFGGPRCHARSGELPELGWFDDTGSAFVRALSTPSTFATDFGEVRVRAAGRDRTDF